MFTKKIQKKQVDTTQPVITTDLPKIGQTPRDLVVHGNLKSSSTVEQNFYLSLGQGQNPYDTQDQTILWRYNIPTIVPGQKKRIVQILGLNAVLINYQSNDFPLKIGLQIQGVTGYSSMKWLIPVQGQVGSWVTIPTQVCAWSSVKQIQGSKQSAGTAYNVSYDISQQQHWDIGMMNVITLRIVDSNLNKISGPFNNPVQLQLRILHLGL